MPSRAIASAGRGLLLAAILAITGVPLLTNILALYQMGVVLRKSPFPFNDRVFLIVVYLGFFLPLSVWIAKGFFDTIPRDLEEAALIDGASPLGALRHVTMPAALPGLTAIFLLTFVNVWNEFLAGYLLVSKNELKPVMFGLYEFLGANIINLQVIAAACVLIALPMVVVFLVARRILLHGHGRRRGQGLGGIRCRWGRSEDVCRGRGHPSTDWQRPWKTPSWAWTSAPPRPRPCCSTCLVPSWPTAERAYRLHTPQAGWVEQDPEELWQALIHVLRTIVDRARGRSGASWPWPSPPRAARCSRPDGRHAGLSHHHLAGRPHRGAGQEMAGGGR